MNFEQKTQTNTKEKDYEKIEKLENEIRDIEQMLYPQGSNVITIPEGMTEKDFDNLDKDTQDACQLTERGMAVDHFQQLQDLRMETEIIGFNIIKEVNFSDNILPSLFRFERLAKIYFQNPILAKIANYLLPEMFIRNALSGYLMPELIKSEIAGYYMHILQKS